MVLDVKIKDTLAENFPDLQGQFLEDAIAVSNVFSQGPKSKQIQLGLKSLSEAIVEKYHVGDALSRQENRAEINIDANGNTIVPTVLRPLTNDEGHALLSKGKIWKDPGIDAGSGGHGEHTHRIQWYILSSQKITTSKPSEFLIEVSKHRVGDTTAGALWDCLFDRLSRPGESEPPFCANGSDDFRCPERLNRHIANAKNNLSDAIKSRADKRDVATPFHEDPGYQEALRQGLFKALGIAQPAQGNPVDEARAFFTRELRGKLKRNEDVNRVWAAAMDYALQKQGLAVDQPSKSLVGFDKRDIEGRAKQALADAVKGHLNRPKTLG